MGSILAQHLADDQVELCVYDKALGRAETLPSPVRKARSIAEAVKGSEYVLASLPDPAAASAAMLSDDGILASASPGTTILDLSTIDPQTARNIYDKASSLNIHYVEAPISGGEPMSAGTDGARKRNITFMVGTDPESFERAKPLMNKLGRFPIHVGPAGMGATVKLISNYISGLHNVVVSEAFVLGKAAGIDFDLMMDVFAHTDANSFWLFNYFGPRVKAGDFEPGFSVDLQYKDLRLADDLARNLKVPMPLNAIAMQMYQMLRADGRGSKDVCEVANLVAEMAGQETYAKQ
jgi:3-hydroxyisobutyrate dehydrogenase-like beta-hydroxyacid dehydrogenase